VTVMEVRDSDTSRTRIVPLVAPASLIRVEDMSRLGGLCQRVARVGLWLKIFGVAFVAFIIEPPRGASLTPERATIAGGLAVVVVASTTLVRRGRLLPVVAYSVVGFVVLGVAGCEIAIAPLSEGGQQSGWGLVLLALMMAPFAIRMLRRYVQGCTAAGVSLWRPVQAARTPPISGAKGLRVLHIHLGLWTPVLLIIQIGTSAVLLSFSALSTMATPVFVPDWFTRPFVVAYARVRHDMHDRIGRSGGYRGRLRLALFIGRAEADVKIKVRSDAMRWGAFPPPAVPFADHIVEQLWLYGVPCIVDGTSTRAWAPQETRPRGDPSTSPRLVLLVAPDTRRPTVAELGKYAPGALLVVRPADNVIEIRRELARVAPRVARQLQEIPDAWLHNALAAAVEPSGAITLYLATAKSQWTYMATLDDAARRLGLENVTATGALTGTQSPPLAASLGVYHDDPNEQPDTESRDPISWWSFKALAAIVLGLWGSGVISGNRPNTPGSHHGELILGVVMVGVALGSGAWATVASLKNIRPRTMMLALAGLAAGSVGVAHAVQVLVA
jgi:hypothetical protein